MNILLLQVTSITSLRFHCHLTIDTSHRLLRVKDSLGMAAELLRALVVYYLFLGKLANVYCSII
jgi:hypothetical protein